jgi:glycosyltransferase involved in cell wall biosynthesis
MKIGFLSRYQKTSNRGAENFVSELSQRLSRENEVIILSGSDSDSFRKITQNKFDVVIPINGRLQSLKASVGRLFSGYKLLITGHSGKGWDDIWNILVRPNIFIATTDLMFNWAQKNAFGVKIEKIPNGIDLGKFNPKGEKINFGLEPPVILCVGALNWYKHHEQAIKAVAKLSNGSLLIIGEGPLKANLAKMGQELLGDKRFKITSLPYQDMPRVYRSAHLFTLPSWDREAFGLVYLEALASGLAVVAPDDLSRKEIVGDAGILVDILDLDKYSQALKIALVKKWNGAPRKQAEKFSWDRVTAEYQKILNIDTP